MTELEAAYTAGIIDGEGSICMNNRRRIPGAVRLGPKGIRVTVGNMNTDLLFWLERTAGGCVCRTIERRGTRQRPYRKWYINGTRAVALIRRVFPYLVVKRRLAELAIEHHALRFGATMGDGKETATRKGAGCKFTDVRLAEIRGVEAALCGINRERGHFTHGASGI